MEYTENGIERVSETERYVSAVHLVRIFIQFKWISHQNKG